MRQSTLKTITTMVVMVFSFFTQASEPIFHSSDISSAEMLVIVCPNSPVIAEITGPNCEANVTIPIPFSDDPNCGIASGAIDYSGTYPDTAFTLLYTVVDSCGMMRSCTQMVLVLDMIGPLLEAPSDTLLSCSAMMLPAATNIVDFVAQGGSVSDICDIDSTSFEVDPDVLVSSSPCMKMYERTYRVADITGNSSGDAIQTLFTNDEIDPVIITCPPAVSGTVSALVCTGMVSVDPLIAMDNCGIQSTVNDYNNTSDASDNYPVGITTVTWTVTDSCGNTATCQTLVTVSDMTAPTATLPTDTLFADCDISEVPPYADLAAFLAAGGTASDQCGSVTFTYNGDVSDNGICPELVSRTYTISDDAMPPNDTNLVQIIRIEESIAPTFTPPGDVTLDCGADLTDVGLVGTISNFADNCSAGPASVSYSDAIPTQACPGNAVITRTYMVMDSCGNVGVGNQSITLQDMTAPVAVCQDVSVYVNSIGEVNIQPEMLNNGSSDNCTPSNLLQLRILGSAFDACNGINLTSMRMLEVSDGCGLMDTCTSLVTVLDTIPPTLTCPPDQNLTCTEDLPLAYSNFMEFEAAGGSWDDNCISGGQDTFLLLSENIPTTFTCPYDITRTYLVSDFSGNTATCVETFTITDSQAPNLSQLPDITINGASSNCDTAIVIGTPGFNDNCAPGDVVITNSINGTNSASGTYPVGTTSVSYYAEDACGNIDTMTFNVIVDGDPMFTCPADIDEACRISNHPPYTSYTQFSMDGGSYVNTCNIDEQTFTLISEDTTLMIACDTIIERLYGITGGAVQFTCTHTIRVRDTLGPVISNPTPLVVGSVDSGICTATIPSITVSASDNCGGVLIVNDFNNTANAGGDYPYGETEVIWTVTDSCGNITRDTTIVLIGDNETPRLLVPMPPTAQCSLTEIDTIKSYAALLSAGGSATDNCMIDTSTFTILRDTITNVFGLLLPTRIYQINDVAGNSTFFSQFLAVMDTQDPTIETLPDTILYTASDTCLVHLILPEPATDDNCQVDTVYNDISLVKDSMIAFGVDTFTVTWTVEDGVGNSATSSYRVIVLDTVPPVVMNPDTSFAICSPDEISNFTQISEVEALNGSVTDACGVDSIRWNASTSGPVPNSRLNIYIVTDINGNTSFLQHIIVTDDNIDPVITNCPDTMFLVSSADSCGATLALDTTGMSISDNCVLDTVFNSFTNGGPDATGFYPVGNTTVQFIAQDAAGNTDTCSFVVSISDTSSPTIQCPQTLEVQCGISDAPAVTALEFLMAGGSFADTCGIDTTTFTSTTLETTGTAVDTLCMRTYARTYFVSDVNGNANSCTQIIEIQDTIAPTFVAVLDTSIYTTIDTCVADLRLPVPIANDNCILDTVYNSLGIAQDSTATFPIDTTAITWYAVDKCGNIDSTSYRVIVLDTIAPVVVDPDTSFAQCNDTIEVAFFDLVGDVEALNGSITDKCGIDSIRFDTSELQAGIPVTAHRFYTAVDLYGNETEFIHVVITMDTFAPNFTAPADTIINCLEDYTDRDVTGRISSVSDNCVVLDTMVNDIPVDTDPCNFQVDRVFVISDAMGNIRMDTQRITVIDSTPPIFNTIILNPADIACTFDEADFSPSQVLDVIDGCDPSPSFSVDTIYTVDLCNGYEVKYLYTGLDRCGNEVKDSSSFMVLPDTLPPVLDQALDTIRLSTDSTTCSREYILPIPTVTDDCTGTTVTNNYSGNTFPLDTTVFEWYLADQCGNIDTVEQVVIVIDSIAPVILCDGGIETVNMNQDPVNLVSAGAFIDFKSDNCTNEYSLIMEVMRVDVNGIPMAACGDAGNATFRDSVSFCCADIGQLTYLMVRVSDLRGNQSICNVTVEVKDNLPPSISSSTALPPVRVSCEYPLDLTDLSDFGKLVFDINDRDPIIVEGYNWGLDGYIIDNCPDHVKIEENVVNQLNRCGQGSIIREFTLTDTVSVPPVSVFTTQTILVDDVSPIVRADITFPDDYIHYDCHNPIVDQNVSGVPTVRNENQCSDVAFNKVDLLFDQVFSGCPTVQRTWTVIDWCQYNTSNPNGPGKWIEVQYIKAKDTIAPVFVPARDTTFCTVQDECDALVNLFTDANDNCTDKADLNYSYAVDTDGNGTYDQFGLGTSFSRRFDFGTYQIQWTVNDGCGNSDVQELTFIVKDCKSPQAVCLNGVSLSLDQHGNGQLWASDINRFSDDNCTSRSDLILSFERDSVVFGRSYNCDSLGQRGVALWVTDAAGNQSVCYTTVVIQDNHNACGSNRQALIGGEILSRGDTPLEGTTMHLEGPEMELEGLTDSLGKYAFENLETDYDYMVEPSNDKNHTLGVSTLDLVLIQRHILDVDPLENPLDLIAADIDNNERITGSDIVRLRKLILGINDRFEDNTSWRFIDVTHDFNEPDYPWPFPERWEMYNLGADYLKTDFVGVKVGDVNGSVNDILENGDIENRSRKDALTLYINDVKFKAGDVISIPVYSKDWLQVIAAQWSMELDNDYLTFEGIQSDQLNTIEQSIADFESHQNIAWYDIDGSTSGDDQVLMTLKFKASKSGILSSVFEINDSDINMIAYNRSDEEVQINFVVNPLNGEDFELYQNSPNPFKETTDVEFALAQKSKIQLDFYDSNGQSIHRHGQTYEAGQHVYRLEAKHIDPSVGVIIYRLTVDGITKTKKMIRLE